VCVYGWVGVCRLYGVNRYTAGETGEEFKKNKVSSDYANIQALGLRQCRKLKQVCLDAMHTVEM